MFNFLLNRGIEFAETGILSCYISIFRLSRKKTFNENYHSI